MNTGQVLSAPLTGGTALLWYVTRATGLVSLVLLTSTVMFGVLGTARAASERWPRIVTASLHRNLALTSVALVSVHVITTVLDPFASIGIVAAFIPGSSAYRPLWLSLGAVSFDLLLAVILSSLLRDRLSHRAWQAVHLLVYASWPIALWHGLGTGTDTRLPWVLVINIGCVAAVGWVIWWRLTLTRSPLIRLAGLAALGLAPVLTAVFVLAGPLQPGWARRAGTPARLLGSRVQPAAGRSATGRSAAAQPPNLVNTPLRGRLSVAKGPGANQRTITIAGRISEPQAQRFVIVLRGSPSGGGVVLSSGTVRIGRMGTASGLSGPVIQLASQELIANVSGRSGRRRAQFKLTISGSAVTGTVSLVVMSGE